MDFFHLSNREIRCEDASNIQVPGEKDTDLQPKQELFHARETIITLSSSLASNRTSCLKAASIHLQGARTLSNIHLPHQKHRILLHPPLRKAPQSKPSVAVRAPGPAGCQASFARSSIVSGDRTGFGASETSPSPREAWWP